jgi:hypothetical protein
MTRRRTFDPHEAKSTPPIADRPDRACNGAEVDFFPDHASGYARAVAVCHRCPHEAECLAWALDTRQSFGVLGGTSPEQRRVMLSDA